MSKSMMLYHSLSPLASGNFTPPFGASGTTTTEASIQAAVSEDVTFSLLRQYVDTGGSGDNTVTFRDAGADGNQTCTKAGAGYAEDAVNTDALTTGDLFGLALTDTGTDPTHSYIAVNVEFASGHGCIHGIATPGGAVSDVASSTRFFALNGFLNADGVATEAQVQTLNRAYASIEAFQVRATANARTNNSVFRNRINGGDGTGVITFGAGVTGLLQDTAVGDSLSDGDLINYSISLGTGVEDLRLTVIAGTYKSTTKKSEAIAAQNNGLPRTASATAHYLALGGHIGTLTAHTDATARVKIGFSGIASNLRCYIGANTYTGNATLKLMQNGAAVLTTTITAGAANQWFENTSDTVTFDDDDELSLELDEGSSGSITIYQIAVTIEDTTGLGQPYIKRIGGVAFMRGPTQSGRGSGVW